MIISILFVVALILCIVLALLGLKMASLTLNEMVEDMNNESTTRSNCNR